MTNTYSEVQFAKPESQNNLLYYNLPLKNNVQQEPQPSVIQKIQFPQQKIIEGFEQNELKQNQQDTVLCVEKDCDQYIKHILECPKCKSIAIKQLGIESDRFKNEEMMEVVDYSAPAGGFVFS